MRQTLTTRTQLVMGCAVVLVLASIAEANMGTALLLFGAFHLWILNLGIGAFEGFWIAKRTQGDVKRLIYLMIVANYFSAWVGLYTVVPLYHLLVTGLSGDHWPLVFGTATRSVFVLVFFGTVLLEAPFAFFFSKEVRRKKIGGLFVFVEAQFLTWLGMALIYSVVSTGSAATDIQWTTKTDEIVESHNNTWVYFLRSSEEEAVWRIRLDGEHLERVAEMPDDEPSRGWWNQELWAKPSSVETSYDLCITNDSSDRPDPILLQGFSDRAGLFAPRRPDDDRPAVRSWNFVSADLRPESERALLGDVALFFFSERGILRIQELVDGEYKPINSFLVHSACDTWMFRQVTNIPGDLAVFEMTSTSMWQRPLIVVMDLKTLEASVLCVGWSPVVSRESDSEAP